MSSKPKTFIDACLSGAAILDEIDDWVEKWHESNSDTQLHAYLGMTEEEYAIWVEQPSVLRFIIKAHDDNVPVSEVLSTSRSSSRIAARGAAHSDDTRVLKEWLQKTGRM